MASFSALAFLLQALALTCSAQGTPHRVVAVDGWHNNEDKPHYRWEATYPGGFSELGGILERLGAARKTITEPLTPKSLAGVDCLIIVDPDIPAENPNPQYILPPEVRVVTSWVRNGGILLLLGNDPGNAEFEHLNQLAAVFGLKFLEILHHDAEGKVKLTLTGAKDHPVFAGGLKFYAVQVAPLQVTNPLAETLLADNGHSIMAVVPFGKGRVFALGDPWLYNEYIHTQDNYRIAENLFRWLFRQAQ